MEIKKKLFKSDDPRIDTALAVKSYDELFDFIEKYPEIMTLDRLAKFIKRCAQDLKGAENAKGKMREYLIKRDNFSFRNKSNNVSYDHLWNHTIVLTMIEGGYFSADYDYDKLVFLVKKYDDGNAMQLAFQWFKDIGYSHQYRALYKLKSCFTSNYIKARLEEGYYLEILTLASLDVFKLPKDITKTQRKQLRKHLFSVLTVNYAEKNISATEQYRTNRIIRAETLFTQCPSLFTMKDIVTVTLTSDSIAQSIYDRMSKDHRQISQKTIAKFLDNRLHQEAMMWVILWYDIELDKNNYLKIYDWIKESMDDYASRQGYYDENRPRVRLFSALKDKFKIVISFDDFLDVLVMCSCDNVDLHSVYSEDIMKLFFGDYKNKLVAICNYDYRSTVKDSRKKKLILDLFFWKYLPWRNLHKEEKIAINEHIEVLAGRYSEQSLLLARRHPSTITLTEESKFAIFKNIMTKEDRKKSKSFEFNFGENIDSRIFLSHRDFQYLAQNDIDLLYDLIKNPQINIDKVWEKLQKPKQLDRAWWSEAVYSLILIENQKFSPTKDEVFDLLKTFSNNKLDDRYFLPMWNALSEDIRPNYLDLCMLEDGKSSQEPKFEMFVKLLKHKLIKLDSVVIDRLLNMYDQTKKQYLICHILSLEIDNISQLSIGIENKKLESILS